MKSIVWISSCGLVMFSTISPAAPEPLGEVSETLNLNGDTAPIVIGPPAHTSQSGRPTNGTSPGRGKNYEPGRPKLTDKARKKYQLPLPGPKKPVYDSTPAEVALAFGIEGWKEGDLLRLQKELTSGHQFYFWQERMRTCATSLDIYLRELASYRRNLNVFADDQTAFEIMRHRYTAAQRREEQLREPFELGGTMLVRMTSAYLEGPANSVVRPLIRPAVKDLSKKMAMLERISNKLPYLSPESIRLTRNATKVTRLASKGLDIGNLVVDVPLASLNVRQMRLAIEYDEVSSIVGDGDMELPGWEGSLAAQKEDRQKEFREVKKKYDRWMLQCDELNKSWNARVKKAREAEIKLE